MRMALSGYTDSRNIYKALEENLAKMYMFKPWDNKELMSIIDRMFELEDVLTNKQIMNLINNINDLPTMPDLYIKIKNLIAEEADIDRIAHAVEMDQASSTRILRIANSAYFGAKTGSIAQAIMYIGLINVKSIVLSNSVFKMEGPAKNEIKNLWRNATLTNRFCNLFYQDILKKRIPNVFASAGLLHNIGMVVLLAQHNGQYEAAMAEVVRSGRNIIDVERELFGITHQEIGGYLLNWWEIPLPIVEAALYHHSPQDERVINRELVHVVHLSNYFAWKVSGDKRFVDSLNIESFGYLGVDSQVVEDYFSSVEIRKDSLE